MSDQGFPIIVYESNKSFTQWGNSHGESFRSGIKELVEIRKELMLAKNPSLKPHLKELAGQQFQATLKFTPKLAEELKGIAQGANLSEEEIVILNNYTDFRDIQLPDEGCSTIHVQKNKNVFSGQTWDMHGSAKKYVSIIHIKDGQNSPGSIIFTLVGCVGLMGHNRHNVMIGVNNINTRGAVPGVIWPCLVRHVLLQKDFKSAKNSLLSAPVTSGHNYLIANHEQGEHWEITPSEQECTGALGPKEDGVVFHTNHCLGKKISLLEDKSSISSTTFDRFSLIDKKKLNLKSLDDLYQLLTDHENHPKSICSHYQSGAQDPSQTCGGGIGDYNNNKFLYWRGCPVYDHNFHSHTFELNQSKSDFTLLS